MRLGLVGYITEIKGSDRLTKNMNTYTRSNPLDYDLLVDGVIPLLNNWDQVFTAVAYFFLVFFFRHLTPQKFIDVFFRSLGY